jgi:hypothetical protein
MAQHKWRAFILTQSNRLEVVEFISPNNNREDASAQCMMMFGAKEIKSINPAAISGSSSSRSDNDRGHSGGSDISWEAIGFLLLIALFVSFWPYFLAAGALYGIYRIVKYIRST